MKKMQLCCCIVGVLLVGCASQQKDTAAALEQASQTSTEQRLERLEQNLALLDDRVDSLGDRTYVVKTKTGKATSMVAVPAKATPQSQPQGRVVPALAAPNKAQAVSPTATSPAPQGRIVKPHAEPAPFPRATAAATSVAAVEKTKEKEQKTTAPVAPKTQGASGRIGTPDTVVGPSGSISSTAPTAAPTTTPPAPVAVQDLALPPSDAPLPEISHLRSLQQEEPAPANAAVAPANAPVTSSVPPQTQATPAASTVKAQPTEAAPATKAAPVAKGEKAAYDQALRTLNRSGASQGIAQFEAFLQQYPQGRFTANAYYWIGEGYYAQGKLQDALAQFQMVDQKFPRHHKNADALLKAGITLERLGDKAGAEQQFQQVLQRFPKSEAARRAKAQLR